MLVISCDILWCLNRIESDHPEILRPSSDLQWGDRCVSRLFHPLGLCSREGVAHHTWPSRESSSKVSQLFDLRRSPYQSLVISYPPSSTFSLFQLFLWFFLLPMHLVLSMFFSFISYSPTEFLSNNIHLVSRAPFFTFDEGHAKKMLRV